MWNFWYFQNLLEKHLTTIGVTLLTVVSPMVNSKVFTLNAKAAMRVKNYLHSYLYRDG